MYLKEESYYSDFYDLQTVERCLRFIEFWREKMPTGFAEESSLKIINLFLYFVKGDRYQHKASFVQECMERDRSRDDLFQNAQEPVNIRCPNCLESMKIILKELHEPLEASARVLYFFECLKCQKRKGVFADGEEFKSKPSLCPKCAKPTKTTITKNGNDTIWQTNCPACGFAETEVDDFEKEKAERMEKETKETELLKKYRSEFCLSAAEGENYLQERRNLEALNGLMKEMELKQTDPDYKKAESLKRWSVVELENALAETLSKEKYEKLSFDKPEIDKHVIIPFTVQDSNGSRKDKESELKLRRIIKKTLEASNWRLMSEGVSYRLGYLSGKLKGYEREEDLVKLIKYEK